MVDILEIIDNIDPNIRAIMIIIILIFQVAIIFFPKDVIMIYVGFLYGTIFGGIINFIGFAGMSVLGYEIGRAGKLGVKGKSYHPAVLKFRSWLDKYGIKALVINRLIPIIPTNWVCVGSGLAQMERKPYVTYSFLTSIPWAFIWSFIGANFLELAMVYYSGEIGTGSIIFIVVTILFTVLSLLLFRKMGQKMLEEEELIEPVNT